MRAQRVLVLVPHGAAHEPFHRTVRALVTTPAARVLVVMAEPRRPFAGDAVLLRCVRRMHAEGLAAQGRIGHPNRLRAIAEALRSFEATELVVQDDLTDAALARFGLPTVPVKVDFRARPNSQPRLSYAGQGGRMTKKTIVIAATVAAVGAGGAGAIAATNNDKAAESAVLSDAAKQLGVSSSDLKDALAKAEDAQLAAQVKAGTITQAQADAVKQHRAQEGTVLNLGPGRRGDFGHQGGGRFLMTDAAKAIGVSERKLFSQLRAGKTLEQVAKANGKTLAEVKAAVKQSAKDRLDADLKAGRITKSQHDEEVSELDDEIARLGTFRGHNGDGRRQFGPPPSAPSTP